MILQLPASAVKFFQRFVPAKRYAPPHVVRVLASYVVALAVTTAPRRSGAAIASEVFAERRHNSTITRMLNCTQFRSRPLHWDTLKGVLHWLAPKTGQTVDWHAALDGTATQRGAFTRILGAILQRLPPQKLKRLQVSGRKGRRTKYHTFLIGVLTTHEGVRIPLPRYTCDPKGFQRTGRPLKKRKTQLDLARLMLRKLVEILPVGVRLIVTADSFFESAKLITCARMCNFVFISPLDITRCFADPNTPDKSNGECIRDYGLNLEWEFFDRLDLERGSEDTASYRRYSERKVGPNDRRSYWLHHERRTVAKLGTVGVVFSWKSPVYEPKRNFNKKSFKVLMCSDPNLSAREVVEWYECRWTAIEIVFRELKQYLGLVDFTGQTLEAFERHIDLVLISFLYLEVERANLLANSSAAPQVRRRASTARTLGMQNFIRAETASMTLTAVRKAALARRPSPRVMAFLDESISAFKPAFAHLLFQPALPAVPR